MYPAERRSAILQAARSGNGLVSVAHLRELLGVTQETVRRDLDHLERDGVLKRQHGGARLVRPISFEQTLAERQASEAIEKQQISRELLGMLPESGVVLIDSGGLPLTLAKQFPTDRELTVVTNNLPAARHLARAPALTVLTLPGGLRKVTLATVDEWTRESLGGLSVDLAIIGANGLTAESVTTTIPAEAAVKRAMLKSARVSVLALTASKIGSTSFCSFARVHEFTHVVTDSRISPEHCTELVGAGANLVVANE